MSNYILDGLSVSSLIMFTHRLIETCHPSQWIVSKKISKVIIGVCVCVSVFVCMCVCVCVCVIGGQPIL